MSTSSIQMDSNNDILLDSAGNIVMITDIDAMKQDVRSATLMRLGEDIYNVNSGVGFFEYIFTPQQSYDDARKSLITAITSSPDVISVESLELTIVDNTFEFVAQINSIYGQLTVTNQ